MRRLWLGLIVLLAAGPDAAADEGRADLTIGPDVSTLGIGLQAGLRFNDHVGARIGGNWFEYDFERSYDDVDYDVDLDLGSPGALLDIYPFGGGFRLSGGVRLNFNRADLTGSPNGGFEIGDTTYSADEIGTLDGGVDFNTLSPYLGLGYAAALFDGALELAFDAGTMYHGSPDVSLSASGGSLAGDPAVQADLEEEREAIEDDLDAFRFYPVVGFAITWRF